MTPDLVIFDCDGVLVDTEGPTSQVIAASLARFGLHIPPTEVDTLFTGGTMMCVEQEARCRGADLPEDWLPMIYGEVFERLAQGVEVVAGAVALLDALDARAIPSFVASNGPMQKMRVSLGPSGLWDRFGGDKEGRILSREHHKPKPDPAMILHALERTGAQPDRTVMIDDSPSGCKAAIAAGVRCIGLDAYGHTERLLPLGIELAGTLAEAQSMILGSIGER